MEARLDGRNAIITGGSAGIGKAIAKNFLSSGANVAIIARRSDVLEAAKVEIESLKSTEGSTGKVIALSADIRLAEECKNVVTKVEAELGHIDVLVNNAGTSQRGNFLEVTDEIWQDDLDLKLFAAVRLSRLIIPGMRSRKWGRIINVLNLGAKAPNGGGAPTAVSRAAGMALTKVLANENAGFNILVNGLLVGRIKSDQWERRHAADTRGLTLEEWYEDEANKLNIERFGTAEEFANMATFLASDSGSYINGTAINVDGGSCPVV
jgi:NAD(P)-dependent dehydrogenase (short-subunit alcohol dehydrogenase family)